MKTAALILALAFGAAAWTATAQDQGGPPPDGNPPPPSEGGHRPPLPAIVVALDLNKDGIIDADEIAKASESLKTLDKNGDGQLTPDEYMGPPPPRHDGGPGGQGCPTTGTTGTTGMTGTNSQPPPPPFGGKKQGGPGGQHRHPPILPIVAALDLNHDGIIDADEIAKAPESLKTLDKNGDGQLTPDEYMGPPPPHRWGGPGPGGPGRPGRPPTSGTNSQQPPGPAPED